MKDARIRLKINGDEVLSEKGKTVLQVALENGYDISYLCYHPDISKRESCNLCLVEVKGENEMKQACRLEAREGMEVYTDSVKIKKKVSGNLKAVLDKHALGCNDCLFFQKCKLLEISRKFGLRPGITDKGPFYTFENDSIFIDQSKCIGCGNCAVVCPVDFLNINSNGRVEPYVDEKKDCTGCGQCITHCPVGAIKGLGEFGELKDLEKLFRNKKKTVVVQFAPSIRTSIGEEFGMKAGSITTGKLVSGLKKAGFQYVFDTATGADFTTMEESEELLERINNNERLPAMSSCCPAWVKFVEFNYPQFIPNLCTSRSPQTILGTLIKEYWGKLKKINQKDIFVVSVMPCVAKKSEIKRKELKVRGRFPVDMVITTREAARMFKNKGIDLGKMNEEPVDNLFGPPSGAGVIYGSSGGVFESALRTAFFRAGEEGVPDVREIRTSEGIKKKEITVGDRRIRVCVANGLSGAITALLELEKDKNAYDALEVMACFGGCVGGGGQPVPANKDVITKRSESLYKIDEQNKTKCAHENKPVLKTYEEFLSDKEIRKEMLHTNYIPRKTSNIVKKERHRC